MLDRSHGRVRVRIGRLATSWIVAFGAPISLLESAPAQSCGSAPSTSRVSVNGGGAEGNAFSSWPSISADGRFVAFESLASNLVAGDHNGVRDAFVFDRMTGNVVRASVATGGTEANAAS